jgi:hypothetical protein
MILLMDRIVAHTPTTVTVRAYGRDRVEPREHRVVHPTGTVTVYDRVTGEFVRTDVATDRDRVRGY